MADISYLVELPTELFLSIAFFLDSLPLLNLRATCKLLNDIISSTPALQYTILLHATGMCDNPFHPSAIPERLARLKAYEEMSHTPHLVSSTHVLTHPLRHFSNNPSERRLDDGTVLFLEAEGSWWVRILRAPVASRGRAFAEWEIKLVDEFTTLAYDAVQDLLVLGRVMTLDNSRWMFRIRVLTLSAGTEHPEAARPTFDATGSVEYDMAPKLRVWGSRVAVVNHSVGNSAVYDWRTGDLVLSLPHENVFVFLPPDKLVVYTTRHPAPQTTDNFLALHSLSSRTPSTPTRAYHLPDLAPYYLLTPARPPSEIDALAVSCAAEEPFSPDPSARALAFHFTLTHAPPDYPGAVRTIFPSVRFPSQQNYRTLRLTFLARAFLAMPVPQDEVGSEKSNKTLDVPWHAWSAHAHFEAASVEMVGPYGRVDSLLLPEHLCTFDFWPPRVRRTETTESTKVVRERAVLSGEFFADGKDVHTCLPRVVRLRKLPKRPRRTEGARVQAYDAVVDVTRDGRGVTFFQF